MDGALGVESLGHVVHERGESVHLAVGAQHRGVVPLAVDGAAAARRVGERGLVSVARIEELAAHRLGVLALVVGGEEQRHGLADRVGRGIAEDRLGRRVPLGDASLHVPLEHRERRALEVDAQLLRREELALLRLAPLAAFLAQRRVRFLQA